LLYCGKAAIFLRRKLLARGICLREQTAFASCLRETIAILTPPASRVLRRDAIRRIISAPARRQFFQSVDRHEVDPKKAATSTGHNSHSREAGWREQAVRRRDLYLRPMPRSWPGTQL